MAEETTQEVAQAAEEVPQGAEPEGRDWKAEYDRLLQQSRKWEDRAKKNAQAAKELDEIRAQSMTDAERASAAEKRAEEAEARVAEYERREELAGIVEEVASERGVDASVLAEMGGEDREAIEAKADLLARTYGDRPIYPSVPDNGQTRPRKMTEKDVREIRDPAKRIRARAELNAQKRKG